MKYYGVINTSSIFNTARVLGRDFPVRSLRVASRTDPKDTFFYYIIEIENVPNVNYIICEFLTCVSYIGTRFT